MPVLLALALVCSIPLVQIDTSLYLLALTLIFVGVSSWRAMVAPQGQSFTLQIPTGRDALLAAVALGLLAANVCLSTVPMMSHWFVWLVGLFPLAYLSWMQASTAARWQKLFMLIVAVVAAAALWVAVEFMANGGNRASGPFRDYNALAALMYLLAIPLAALLAFTADSSRKTFWLHAALLELFLFALFATASRGGTAVILIAIPLTLACAKRAGVKIKRPAQIVASLAAIAYAAIKLYQHKLHFRTLDLADDLSTQARIDMWKSTIHAWRDHPFIGTGLGTYSTYYTHYRLPTEIASSGDMAHSDYLQFLMEGGPLLLALLLIAGASCLWLTWKLWQAAGDSALTPETRREKARGFSLALAAAGLFVHASVNFIFYVPSLALLAGLYLAQSRTMLALPTLKTLSIPIKRTVGAFAVAALGLLVVGNLLVDWAGNAIFSSDVKWKPLTEIRQSPARSYKIASLLLALHPQQVNAHQAASYAAMNMAMAQRGTPGAPAWSQRALRESKDWLASNPSSPFAYLTAGQLLLNFPALAGDMGPEFSNRPEIILSKSINLYPASPDGYWLLAQYYLMQSNKKAALVVLSHSLPWLRIPITSQDTMKLWMQLLDLGKNLATELNHTELSAEERAAVDDFLATNGQPAASMSPSDIGVKTSAK